MSILQGNFTLPDGIAVTVIFRFIPVKTSGELLLDLRSEYTAEDGVYDLSLSPGRYHISYRTLTGIFISLGIGSIEDGDILTISQFLAKNNSISNPLLLSMLSDVSLTSPLTGQVLSYQNNKWVNSSLPEIEIPTWDTLQDKPLAFPPIFHLHDVNQINGLESILNTKVNQSEINQIEIQIQSLEQEIPRIGTLEGKVDIIESTLPNLATKPELAQLEFDFNNNLNSTANGLQNQISINTGNINSLNNQLSNKATLSFVNEGFAILDQKIDNNSANINNLAASTGDSINLVNNQLQDKANKDTVNNIQNQVTSIETSNNKLISDFEWSKIITPVSNVNSDISVNVNTGMFQRFNLLSNNRRFNFINWSPTRNYLLIEINKSSGIIPLFQLGAEWSGGIVPDLTTKTVIRVLVFIYGNTLTLSLVYSI